MPRSRAGRLSLIRPAQGTHEPLAPLTTYRVRITGTYTGGALDLDWTFTTRP